MNETEANNYYQDGGNVAVRMDNNGTPIGYVSVDQQENTSSKSMQEDKMGNLINNILTLGNKEKYMVLNQAVYQNKNYYLVVQVSENEEEVLGKFKFLEETEVDGEKAVAVVKDEKIIELLAKYLKPQQA